MKDMEGFAKQEIAQRLGMQPKAVSKALERARHKLRGRIAAGIPSE